MPAYEELLKPSLKPTDPMAFSFKVEGTISSCMGRQVREEVLITYGEADKIMNNKT